MDNIDSKKKIDLSEKLDLNDTDLTAPEIVIKEILSQLPEQTNRIVFGDIKNYDGPVKSYKEWRTNSFNLLSGSMQPEIVTVDIQNSLGATYDESKKFECFLYTNVFPDYKYRLFFVKYNIATYPVELIVEQNVADSLSQCAKDNIFSCKDRDELEDLVCEILTCKKTISVMQEIVRIAQVKKLEMANTDEKK